MIARLALRNIFRNTRRTLLTALLIGCSLTALILVDGIIIGTEKLMVESLTDTITGDAQVHANGFRENYDSSLYIPDTSAITAELAQDPQVTGFAERIISGAMVASSYNVAGGLMYGIDAVSEPDISKIDEAIISGQYLSGTPGKILLGKSMAELLEVSLGDRIVLTLSEADTGEISQALFRVSGIFEFGARELDENFIFINLDRARQVLGMARGAHEIVITGVSAEQMAADSSGLLQRLTDQGYEALSWRALNHDIAAMLDMTGYSAAIVGAILFLLASLGVINSMFMSIYERIYEFGVARAIGTRPADLMLLVLAEAFFIGLLSCALGLLLAGPLTWWFSIHGIPMGEMEFAGVAINKNFPLVPALYQFLLFPGFVVVLTLVAALYPAIFAARIIPSEALHKSL
ncbi:MAG: ABC transporter permease [Pseudomonadales bacterium]|nr:ABC transporter permease [Pseudomonadales bacterium]